MEKAQILHSDLKLALKVTSEERSRKYMNECPSDRSAVQNECQAVINLSKGEKLTQSKKRICGSLHTHCTKEDLNEDKFRELHQNKKSLGFKSGQAAKENIVVVHEQFLPTLLLK